MKDPNEGVPTTTTEVTVRDNHQWEINVPTSHPNVLVQFNSIDDKTECRCRFLRDGIVDGSIILRVQDLLKALELIRARH